MLEGLDSSGADNDIVDRQVDRDSGVCKFHCDLWTEQPSQGKKEINAPCLRTASNALSLIGWFSTRIANGLAGTASVRKSEVGSHSIALRLWGGSGLLSFHFASRYLILKANDVESGAIDDAAVSFYTRSFGGSGLAELGSLIRPRVELCHIYTKMFRVKY